MDSPTQNGRLAEDERAGPIRVRRYRGRNFAMVAGIGLLIVLVVALAALWIARRPIANQFMESEFKQRGVDATYRLDRVGLRTQQVSNLVIGDPKRPDLTARFAQIQTRIRWNGSVEVYRIVARGVRLRGRLVGGKVELGPDRQIAAAADRQAVPTAQFRARHRRQQHRPGDAVRAPRSRVAGQLAISPAASRAGWRRQPAADPGAVPDPQSQGQHAGVS